MDWVFPAEMAGAEVGVSQGGPRALCAEDAVTERLKLKLVLSQGVLGLSSFKVL